MTQTAVYRASRIESDLIEEVGDVLAVEHPLSIRINGSPFTLTMQTPGDEFDLTRGLLFTEGVLKNQSDSWTIEVSAYDDRGLISAIDVTVDESLLHKAQLNKRSLLSAASCGICGKTELTQPVGNIGQTGGKLTAEEIHRMFAIMHEQQSAFRSSGGAHGAAVFDEQQHLLVLREDIGRHNAVDKAIGSLLAQCKLAEGKYLLVSGRVSYEIVVKCFSARIPRLLAVSAPSSLAVDFCKELGIELWGFCRERRATCYSRG